MRHKMSRELLEISWLSYKRLRGSLRRWTQASDQSYFNGREEFSISTSVDMGLFSMEEVAIVRRLMSRLETFVGVLSKEEVDTLYRLMSQ
jgi:hypothetical protein